MQYKMGQKNIKPCLKSGRGSIFSSDFASFPRCVVLFSHHKHLAFYSLSKQGETLGS